jgi:hypothetical protein
MVTDAETKAPLTGANVTILNTQRGATTDADGRYRIADVPVGSYTVRVSYIGYETHMSTDIIIRSARVTPADVALTPEAITGAAVEVHPAYFGQISDVGISSISLSQEDIRREAGTGKDISRIITALPSISKGNDTRNDLIVRGGSPIENAFIIDNFEVPNINHYPQFGASGGALGIINIDAVRDVDFSAGGFSSRYGDRLSSVMNISLREGGREAVDFKAELDFMGAGVRAEGPLPGHSGSWLLSARRSWLDFLLQSFSSESHSSSPTYSDALVKAVADLPGGHTITFLDVFATDKSSSTPGDALDSGENTYGRLNSTQNTAGLGWTWLWGPEGYTVTTLALTTTRYDQWYGWTTNGEMVMRNGSGEDELKLRSMNLWRISDRHSLEAGVDGALRTTRLDADYSDISGINGEAAQPLAIDDKLTDRRVGIFANYTWRLVTAFAVTLGARADYYEKADRFLMSPRMCLRWDLSQISALTASAGLYSQSLPAILSYQHEENAKLPLPRAAHAVLGFSHLITENTRALIEVYYKEYTNLPIDPEQPSLSVLDELAQTSDYFTSHSSLKASGKARSFGVEISIQKKLVEDLYGTVSGSLGRSMYCDATGAWRDRAYDNRYSLAVMGGYKPWRDWEFSVRWIAAGGAPYTPFDVAASEAAHRGVLDMNRVQSERLPAYHSLNIRADKRFFFSGSTLTAYLAIWNVYGRKNVPFYRWNEDKNRLESPNLWCNNPMPVFGVEYEF